MNGFLMQPSPEDDATGHATERSPSGAECTSEAVWRSTPLAQDPTANENFLPETSAYWTKTVLGAAWPALIGLGAAAALLLIFLLWRCLHCCCGWCCCCCSGGRKGKNAQPKYITARWLTCLKVLVALLLAGLADGCALGMARMDTHLVGAGLKTVDDVQYFLANILNTGKAAVAAADGVGVMLGTVQNVLNTDVIATDLELKLRCIAPWLDGLPDPATLTTDIQAIRDSVDSVLAPALADLAAQLDGLEGALAPAPAAGPYTVAVQAMVDGQALLADAPDGLIPQAEAFAVAALDLDPTIQDPAKLTTARTALAALLTSPQQLSNKIAAVAALRAALQTVHAAGTTDSYVPAIQAALENIRDVALDAKSIADTLRDLQSDYLDASPCITAVLSRAQRVNASVLVIPDELARPVALLQRAEDSLSGLVNSTNSPASLADVLENALPLAAIEAAIVALERAADVRTFIQGLGLPAIISALQAAEDDLTAAQPQLGSALAAMQNYETTYGSAGGMPPASWAALVAAVRSAGTAVNSVTGQLPSTGAVFSQASSLQEQLPGLHTVVSALNVKVGEMQGQLASVPDVAPYLASLAGVSAMYAELPQPPSQLALDAQATVQDIVRSVQQVLTDGQATIRQQTAEVRRSIADAEEQTVQRLGELKADVEPLLRKFDTIRLGVLYGLFSAACLFGAILVLSKMLNWPFGIKLLLVLNLLLSAVFFIVVLALSFVLKAGSDGCSNLDAQIIMRISEVVNDPEEAANAMALARYYLSPSQAQQGCGADSGTLEGVLLEAVQAIFREINTTREELLQDIVGSFVLKPLLSVPVDRAVELSYAVEDGLAAVLAMAARDAVQPVYKTVKSFACCRTLDLVGWQWLALVLAGSCATALCLLAFSFVASLDKLGRVKGCCARYNKQHFADEAPFLTSTSKPAPGSAAVAAAALAGPAGKAKPTLNLTADARPGSTPRSPGADSQFIVSWHNRHNLSLASPAGGSAASEAGAGEGGGRNSGTDASLRNYYSAENSPVGSPMMRSAVGSPRGSAAAAETAAATMAASRAELFGRGSGASVLSRGSVSATASGGSARGSGASAKGGRAAAAGGGSARGSGAAAAAAAGSGRSSVAQSPRVSAAPAVHAASGAAAEEASRAGLLSPAKSVTGSSSGDADGSRKASVGSRFKFMFKK